MYGKNQGDVDETSVLNPATSNSITLVTSEDYLKNKFKNLSIIRPGGLYGDKRHPIYFLAGKKNLVMGNEFLHLVHRNDCINAIESIIEKNIFGEIFNLVSDLRILKKQYYLELATKLKLEPPLFDDVAVLNPTRIKNDKSKKMLKINYLNPNDFS